MIQNGTMTEALVQIRKGDVVRDIRELASLTGRTLTEAVATAVRAELERVRRTSDIQERSRAISEIVRRLHESPIVGPPLTDDDLYDENGLPR